MIGEKRSRDKRWVRIAYCKDIPLREGRAVRVNGREVAIFNLGDRFVAMDNRCPHRGGPLADGIVSGTTIVCPLHAWKFSVETGAGVTAPSQASCVETFRTRVTHGIVLLELPTIGAPDRSDVIDETRDGPHWTWPPPVRVVGMS